MKLSKKLLQEEALDYAVAAVNTRCPITGDEFDRFDLTENRVRTYNGQILGFCSADCPHIWDDLDDDEKEERYNEAVRGW